MFVVPSYFTDSILLIPVRPTGKRFPRPNRCHVPALPRQIGRETRRYFSDQPPPFSRAGVGSGQPHLPRDAAPAVRSALQQRIFTGGRTFARGVAAGERARLWSRPARAPKAAPPRSPRSSHSRRWRRWGARSGGRFLAVVISRSVGGCRAAAVRCFRRMSVVSRR